MSAQELSLTVRLDDGLLAEARIADPSSAEKLRKVAGDPEARKGLMVRTVEPGDTAGHMLGGDTIMVSVRLEDDLEGHTMSLRLPSSEEARRFQKRLIISGVLAASIVAGAAGAELASQQAARSQALPAPGPAIVAPAVGVGSSTVTPKGPPHDEALAVRHAGPSTSTGTTEEGRVAPPRTTRVPE